MNGSANHTNPADTCIGKILNKLEIDQFGCIIVANVKRVYKNSKITVYWDSSKCIHSTICMAELPHVFNPKKRPWVNINAENAEEIKCTVDKCPSGALTCELNE